MMTSRHVFAGLLALAGMVAGCGDDRWPDTGSPSIGDETYGVSEAFAEQDNAVAPADSVEDEPNDLEPDEDPRRPTGTMVFCPDCEDILLEMAKGDAEVTGISSLAWLRDGDEKPVEATVDMQCDEDVCAIRVALDCPVPADAVGLRVGLLGRDRVGRLLGVVDVREWSIERGVDRDRSRARPVCAEEVPDAAVQVMPASSHFGANPKFGTR